MLLLRGFMEKQNDHGRDQLKQCILSIRKGNQRAFDQLLAEYTPLVESQVLQYGKELTQQDREDLRQEALYALHRSALNYDFDRSGVEFGLYAKICINNRLISARRHKVRGMKKDGKGVGRPRKEARREPKRRVSGRALPSDEQLQTFLDRAKEDLTKKELAVLNLYLAGASYKEMARQLHCTEKSVDNALARAKKKIKKYAGTSDPG